MRAIRRIGCPIVTLAVSVLFSTSLYPQPTPKIQKIVIEKSAHTMVLMRDDKVWKSYKVALSRQAVGAKEREGDHKVPEGDYVVDSKNAHSRFISRLHFLSECF